MAQTAQNTESSEMQACEEMQVFFNENKLLPRACEETSLGYDAARHALRGATSKIPMMTAIVLTKWVALWKAAEADRMALSNVVKGIVEK